MSVKLPGENLIFLISQPRAGSTMLQRILGSHPDIHSMSEPWLMLHPFYALRPKGYEAEYDSHIARNALQSFLQMLPDGEDGYFEALRLMYIYMYESALESTGKQYFLDKTPRYYFVIPELYRTFPKANYIILLRNPMAVLCSVIKTWVKDDLLSLYSFKHDMIRSPQLLLNGTEILGDRCIVVHYESLLEDTNNEIKKICKHIGIDFVPEMIEYGYYNLPQWQLGDQEDVYQNIRPSLRNVKKWNQALEDPQIWRLTNDYLKLLGRELIEKMGYSYDKLLQEIESSQTNSIRVLLTFPLVWLIDKPAKDRKRWLRRIVRLVRCLQQRGIL